MTQREIPFSDFEPDVNTGWNALTEDANETFSIGLSEGVSGQESGSTLPMEGSFGEDESDLDTHASITELSSAEPYDFSLEPYSTDEGDMNDSRELYQPQADAATDVVVGPYSSSDERDAATRSANLARTGDKSSARSAEGSSAGHGDMHEGGDPPRGWEVAEASNDNDPFLDSNLPLAKTPVSETVRDILDRQGAQAVWSTILNTVLAVDGVTATDFMGGATFYDDGRVSWSADVRPDIAQSRLVDRETDAGITLQIVGEPSAEEHNTTGVPLYVAHKSTVSMIGRHRGPTVKATFNDNQLIPVEAQITRGYDELPPPPIGTWEDPHGSPRTVKVEGVTDVSVIKMMSATYRAAQQLRSNR